MMSKQGDCCHLLLSLSVEFSVEEVPFHHYAKIV
jgi:hypothetical protein